jgi:hypothetical protein
MAFTFHVIAFDVPYPPNYGGVIDVFYKLKHLHQAGATIHLHCYHYGRDEATELLKYCKTVTYYKRNTKNVTLHLSLTPFTVLTRRSKTLEENLLKDNHPILFEVLHTCYLLNDSRFEKRIKLYRHSNIEHEYYKQLAQSEKSFLKRLYLYIEAFKLKRFESIVSKASAILAVNEKDTLYFQNKYPQVKTIFLPSFHNNTEVKSKLGKGEFVLYHGNLSISENYEAAQWLIDNVFTQLPNLPFVIAGKNPPLFLQEKIKKFQNIKLIADPTETEMNNLIETAHVHCLYTNQGTGLKLKLLNVLYGGRFVVCNSIMLNGTSFSKNGAMAGVSIVDSASDFIAAIEINFLNSFSENEQRARQVYVHAYDNAHITRQLMDLLTAFQSSL